MSMEKNFQVGDVVVYKSSVLEQVICEEFSVVLGVPPKQIKERLYGSLKRRKNAK